MQGRFLQIILKPLFEACPIPLTQSWTKNMKGLFVANDNAVGTLEKNVAHLFTATTIYFIWQERNMREHQERGEKKRKEAQLIYLIKREMRENLFYCISFKRNVGRDKNLAILL